MAVPALEMGVLVARVVVPVFQLLGFLCGFGLMAQAEVPASQLPTTATRTQVLEMPVELQVQAVKWDRVVVVLVLWGREQPAVREKPMRFQEVM